MTCRREPHQQRARETVDRILVAATQLFGDLGYDATTTNDIAAVAGASIGSLSSRPLPPGRHRDEGHQPSAAPLCRPVDTGQHPRDLG